MFRLERITWQVHYRSMEGTRRCLARFHAPIGRRQCIACESGESGSSTTSVMPSCTVMISISDPKNEPTRAERHERCCSSSKHEGRAVASYTPRRTWYRNWQGTHRMHDRARKHISSGSATNSKAPSHPMRQCQLATALLFN